MELTKIQNQLRALTIQLQNNRYMSERAKTSDKIQAGSCTFYIDTINNVFVVDSTMGIIDPVHIDPFNKAINNLNKINDIDLKKLIGELKGKNGITVTEDKNNKGLYYVSIEKNLYDKIMNIDEVYRKKEDLVYIDYQEEEVDHPTEEDDMFYVDRINAKVTLAIYGIDHSVEIDLTDTEKYSSDKDWRYEIEPTIIFYWSKVNYMYINNWAHFQMMFQILSLKKVIKFNDSLALDSSLEKYRKLTDLEYDNKGVKDKIALKSYVDDEIANIDIEVELKDYRKKDDVSYEKYEDLLFDHTTETRLYLSSPTCTSRFKGTYGTDNKMFNIRFENNGQTLHTKIEEGVEAWWYWHGYFCIKKDEEEVNINVTFYKQIRDDELALKGWINDKLEKADLRQYEDLTYESREEIRIKNIEGNKIFLEGYPCSSRFKGTYGTEETYFDVTLIKNIGVLDVHTVIAENIEAWWYLLGGWFCIKQNDVEIPVKLTYHKKILIKDELALKGYVDTKAAANKAFVIDNYRTMEELKYGSTDSLATESVVDSKDNVVKQYADNKDDQVKEYSDNKDKEVKEFVDGLYRKKKSVAFGFNVDCDYFTVNRIDEKKWTIQPQKDIMMYIKIKTHIAELYLRSTDVHPDGDRSFWLSSTSDGYIARWYSDDFNLTIDKDGTRREYLEFEILDTIRIPRDLQPTDYKFDRFALYSEIANLKNEINELRNLIGNK